MTKYIICLAGGILLLSGCGNNAGETALEKQIEKETGADADVDISKDRMHITGETEDGSFSLSSGEGIQIPDNFPSDILIYKPSELKATIDTPNGQSLTFATADDVDTVIGAYKREMKAEGWAEKASMNMGQQSMLVYQKSNRAVQITAGQSGGQTQILLLFGDK